MIRSITPAAILTVVSNGIALAVAFGVHLSTGQTEAVLAFVGSVTSLVFAIYAAVHVQHVKTAAALALGSSAAKVAA